MRIAGAARGTVIRGALTACTPAGYCGGFPVAAMGGRKDIMALVADGIVSMAGTYAANVIAVAAANAALDELAATFRTGFDADDAMLGEERDHIGQ